MSKDQWNARYESEEYIYGVQPNAYLKEQLSGLKPGSILFPAEGEGRNAIYAAGNGWTTFAFDQSEAGRMKAMQLAAYKNVSLQYDIISLDTWEVKEEQFDCICLIFVHLPVALRKEVHLKVKSALKPGGILIFEAFTRDQMPRTSGGPKNLELLYDPAEIRADFEDLEFLDFEATETILDEGALHKGMSDVIHFTARKPKSSRH